MKNKYIKKIININKKLETRMLGSQKKCSTRLPTLGVGFLRLTADCARRLILQPSLEILRHILRPEIGKFSIHLLYKTRYGR